MTRAARGTALLQAAQRQRGACRTERTLGKCWRTQGRRRLLRSPFQPLCIGSHDLASVSNNLRRNLASDRTSLRAATTTGSRKNRTAAWLTPTDHDGDPDPLRPWEIELPPWLYNTILRRRDILAV